MSSIPWLSSLYRVVLRTNRVLAPELRTLGDAYANSEFKLVRNAERAGKLTRENREAFVQEWSNYCESVAQQIEHASSAREPVAPVAVDSSSAAEPGFHYVGENLPEGVVERLSADQRVQLQRLQLETLRLHRKERG